jgi:hypothetical protein
MEASTVLACENTLSILDTIRFYDPGEARTQDLYQQSFIIIADDRG